jgi:tetratricopeptide (TPR) repeat protein
MFLSWQKARIKTGTALAAIFALLCLNTGVPALASKQPFNANVDRDQQHWINKGNSYAKSGKADPATEAYKQALASADSVASCLAIADSTEHYGHVLMDARRACLTKAQSLAKSRDDLCQIALKARQFELYEITKSTIDTMIAHAQTNDELYDLARKAQSVSLNDVAHLSLEKAYTQTTSVSEALRYAKQAKLLGMEDLCRKAIKDLVDDESDAHELLALLKQIDPLQEEDLNRKLLKKALDCVKDVDQCKEVFDTARRYDQRDIVALASYRGKRMILLKQYKEDQAKYQDQLQTWRAGKLDQQEQQAANQLMKDRQGKGQNDAGF